MISAQIVFLCDQQRGWEEEDEEGEEGEWRQMPLQQRTKEDVSVYLCGVAGQNADRTVLKHRRLNCQNLGM